MYQRINIELLEPNKGQIKGLPKNPRKWSDEDLQDLAASLKETPELYDARPLLVIPFKKKFVVLGGNMREAASVLNGDPDAPCWVYDEKTPVEKLKEIVLKDNSSFGAWDTEAFAKDWSWTAGKKWGIPDFGVVDDKNAGEDVNPDDYGTEVNLPSGGKSEFKQMTFTLANQQAADIEMAIAEAKELEGYKAMITHGNTNSNGNALAFIIEEWAAARK